MVRLGEGHGVRFEFECYDVGQLYNLAIALEKRTLRAAAVHPVRAGHSRWHRRGGRPPAAPGAHGAAPVRQRPGMVGAGRRPPPDGHVHACRAAGRQCARGAGGQPLHRPRRIREIRTRTRSRRFAAYSRNCRWKWRRPSRRARASSSRAPIASASNQEDAMYEAYDPRSKLAAKSSAAPRPRPQGFRRRRVREVPRPAAGRSQRRRRAPGMAAARTWSSAIPKCSPARCSSARASWMNTCWCCRRRARAPSSRPAASAWRFRASRWPSCRRATAA